MLDKIHNLNKKVTIGLVGKYVQLHDAYLSVAEALRHAGYGLGAEVSIRWIDSETINDSTIIEVLSGLDGVIVPGGFGERGIEGMILTANYCRKNNVPYLGICLGMQIAVISFARFVAGLKNASSGEFDADNQYKVIDFLPDQNDSVAKGGTLRLGAYPCKIKAGTKWLNATEQKKSAKGTATATSSTMTSARLWKMQALPSAVQVLTII